MAGFLHDVFANLRYTPCQMCPEELQGSTILLKPVDNDAIEVDAEAAFASGKVLKVAKAKGPGCEVACPMKKALLTKVIEYMKHHKTEAPKEIYTPLPSNSLTEAGASKWDATFIKVEKEMLFDLMYAAQAMDMGSLLLLANAQISTMLFEKEAAKIRKDFGLTSDLPDDEEGTLSNFIAAYQSKMRLPSDENALASNAAVLAGLYSAADKYGGLSYALGMRDTPEKSTVNLKSYRINCWRAVVMQDWKMLAKAPHEVQGDRVLVLSAIHSSYGAALADASDDLKADSQVVLEAVKYGGKNLSFASSKLRGDHSFVFEAMKVDGSALAGAIDSFRSDRKLIAQAMAMGAGAALSGAVEYLREDKAFVLECAAQAPEALLHAGESLRFNKDFALEAVKMNGQALQYMPMKFKADHEVAAAAMYEDAGAANYAHSSRRSGAVDIEHTKTLLAETPGEAKPVGQVHMMLTREAMESLSFSYIKTEKYIVFTAMSSITANMGQANYIAANTYLDKLAFYERPEVDAAGIMWGTVGGMGMRWKAFASMDMMNLQAHNLLSIDDCCKILHMLVTRMDPPEWFGAQFQDEPVRNMMLAPTAGMGTGGGYRPSEDAAVPAPVRDAPRRKEMPWEMPLVAPEPEPVPLGGWPGLASMPRDVPLPLMEGCRVELVNMSSKNGLTGKVVKYYPEGKCKVALDTKGFALVKPSNLLVTAEA
mmetsp:Transcript_49583/g.106138  ORF Transcript_49583/g.106138 Transcript_49583/m.106138 type:complete len:709 (+) Transcript_49583:116-2242(+)